MFLQELNRLYETIHPPSFQTRYMSWWIAQESNDRSGEAVRDEDIDFGLLVLRVCLLSIQSLPHSKFPTIGVLKSHPEAMEQWYSSLADELDKSQPPTKKPSIETVQHRFLHVGYLKNYGKVRASWSVLSTAVRDAHEMGLHLKDPGIPISDLEMELRRRTFWNLYVWDRYMCTFFGHWPLIPEGYFDIEPPHDNLQPFTVKPYVLTPFTDRIFHIKLARYLTAFMSPPSWKSDQQEPAVASEFAQRFHQVILDQLPPPFSLESPDVSWDVAHPALTMKRETLGLFIHIIEASLYRSFMDPCKNLHHGHSVRAKPGPDLLALSHRRSLMETTCKIISCIGKLYALTGNEEGGSIDRLFTLPVALVDSLATLGVCLLSIQADERRLLKEGMHTVADSILQRSYNRFFDAFGLLYRQAPHNTFAKRGVKVLEGLHGALRAGLSGPDRFEASPTGSTMMGSFQGPTHRTEYFQLEQALVSLHANGGGEEPLGRSFIALPEWLPSFLESPARNWLIHSQFFFGDILA
ncbi:uncharacterized protein N7477_003450 [Penicillium maclennaniae]|uniref:uncharacterized protein n=1 Tax=Penicillium maclennaniae TaxID=1343394 RepID=UPI00253FD826|nr:uncharacterized protein N7477_003450 [Penicillium maclennaniae]KAJ5677817.1 hypothetical protein N7477_003450 [Penicillium maclennaniae]